MDFFAGRIGSCLDVGAFDGRNLSNTRALIELGWKAKMVEPDPFNLCKLCEEMRPFSDRVEIVAAAVSTSGVGWDYLRMDETEGRGWASSIVPVNPGVLRQSPLRYRVPTIRIGELMTEDFQFISIDAEHMDMEILKDMPARMMKSCEMLCIEPSDLIARERMKRYIVDELGLGFKIHHETPENIMASRILPSSKPANLDPSRRTP